ncbi:MAG: S10 family peptidase [Candidatus Hodarchaeales archaeon]|jgi:carboxypeptidase C (cathepsin A)
MSEKEKGKEKDKLEKEKPAPPKDVLVESNHQSNIANKDISYTVTTGTIVLKKEEDEKEPQAKASIFFIAYVKDGVDDQSKRPITFSFNGGPGSSSVWLHLGVLGPKRVIVEENEQPVSPPYKLIKNDYSLLDVTDLIFIDPVSTGYSRAVPGEKSEQFHEFKKDIEIVGDFIRLYTTRYNRWSSPKYLIGESYGTTRAAGLSDHLHSKLGMSLNGIMLISVVLNFQTISVLPGNDFPNIFYLPSLTTTAWYHKMLSADLQNDLNQTVNEVRNFAMNEYSLALMKGDTISEEEKKIIESKLSRYTGLSEKYINGTNLRIQYMRFLKELLREKHRTVGRLDSRFTGIDLDDTASEFEYDPSYDTSILGPYTATFNDYVRGELKFESDLPYEILAPLYEKWRYEKYDNQFVNVGETLRNAMSKNPFLKVFIANGYYDLATPFLATEYTVNHLGLDPELRKNIKMEYYNAGHMMYIHEPSLKRLSKSLKDFITDSAS